MRQSIESILGIKRYNDLLIQQAGMILNKAETTEKEILQHCSKAQTKKYLTKPNLTTKELIAPEQYDLNPDDLIRVFKFYDFGGIGQRMSRADNPEHIQCSEIAMKKSMLQYALTECRCYRHLIKKKCKVIPETSFYILQKSHITDSGNRTDAIAKAFTEQKATKKQIDDLADILEKYTSEDITEKEISEFEDVIIIDMPYGLPLTNIIKEISNSYNRTINNQQWFSLAKSMFDCLHLFQNCGVQHYDIKPANIICYTYFEPQDTENRVHILPYLIDFDVSSADQYKHALSTRTVNANTLFYAAPEMLGNNPASTSDIYSMCITLLEAMCDLKTVKELHINHKQNEALSQEERDKLVAYCKCHDEALVQTLKQGSDAGKRFHNFDEAYTAINVFLNGKKRKKTPIQKRLFWITVALAALALLCFIWKKTHVTAPPAGSSGTETTVPVTTTVTDAAGQENLTTADTAVTDLTETAPKETDTETTTVSEQTSTTETVSNTVTTTRSYTVPPTTPPTTFNNPVIITTTTVSTREPSDFRYDDSGAYCIIEGLDNANPEPVIPSSLNGKPVKEIKSGAFQNNTAIQRITIPAAIETIGANAFEGCSNLTDVSVSGAVKSIGENCFYNSGVQRLYLETGRTNIPSRAFAGCTSLQNLYIPDGVTEIADHAFFGCTRLRNIRLPMSINSIGDKAFFADGAPRKCIFFAGTRDTWDGQILSHQSYSEYDMFGHIREDGMLANYTDSYDSFLSICG